jgi:hypothetical protein
VLVRLCLELPIDVLEQVLVALALRLLQILIRPRLQAAALLFGLLELPAGDLQLAVEEE